MKQKPEVVDLNPKELEAVLDRARTQPLDEQDYRKLKSVIETLEYLTRLLEKGRTSIRRLRHLFFGARTEKTATVFKGDQTTGAAGKTATQANETATTQKKLKAKGHGRNGAARFTGCKHIAVPHESLKPGCACPACLKGKVYRSMEPARLVRLVGQAPIGATVWELENLRCNLCGEVFTAQAPEGVGEEKYDATTAAMIATLKYGSGMPFHRLEGLQENLGIPLPATTQWGIVAEAAETIRPVFDELVRQAAQGEVVHNDDTTAKILTIMKQRAADDSVGNKERTGLFTTGIVSTRESRQIALFFTGAQHAGENLTDLLGQRAAELPPPIQMCDGLTRNLPREFEVVLANCTAHARRRYVEVAPNFPDECRFVLETLRDVYHNDEIAKIRGMTSDERLTFHQAESESLMKKLEEWLEEQIEQRKVEPNSGLGGAISYMRDHWQALTLFLRVRGAPLDNNICERLLKKAILHRKAALFFKTPRGAQVGDLFMSLIHTTELAGGNPFDYLTELLKHVPEATKAPGDWMPWNYRSTLTGLTAPPA